MNDDEKRRIEQVALFRFGVLGDLIHLTPGAKGIATQLAEKAGRDYLIPYSDRTRIAAETIRDCPQVPPQGWLRRPHAQAPL